MPCPEKIQNHLSSARVRAAEIDKEVSLGPGPDLKSLLREMVEKGIHAHLTQAVVRQIFNYAISEDFVLINPAMGFLRFGEQSPRIRIWSDEELAALWASLDAHRTVR